MNQPASSASFYQYNEKRVQAKQKNSNATKNIPTGKY
uniref:Uncharacterized protein n=1 Tax=Anguilla anguilla TaxID=7936 RepID=A0A0E9U5I1_ANGAN